MHLKTRSKTNWI